MSAQLGRTKGIGRRILSIAVFLAAVVYGRLAGLSFVIPVVIATVAFFALKKLMPKERPAAIQLMAVQAGHWGWMSIGFLVPGGFSQVILDVIVLGALLIWFAATRRAASAYALLAFQAVSCAVNIASAISAADASQLVALSVHIVFRVTAMVLIVSFLLQAKRDLDLRRQSAAEHAGG